MSQINFTGKDNRPYAIGLDPNIGYFLRAFREENKLLWETSTGLNPNLPSRYALIETLFQICNDTDYQRFGLVIIHEANFPKK